MKFKTLLQEYNGKDLEKFFTLDNITKIPSILKQQNMGV